MQDTKSVHSQQNGREARGVRMDIELWDFVAHLANEMTNGNRSALIERWVREKRDAVRATV